MHASSAETQFPNDSGGFSEDRTDKVYSRSPEVEPSPPLPRLPSSHLIAHLPFRIACENFDSHSRDWNEEFQKLWDEEWKQVWGTDNREYFEEFLHEYESYCFTLVESLCREGGSSSTWAGKALDQFPDCFRVGNIMLRVWRNDKLGINMQRSFRVLLDCKIPRIAFPLSAAFRYYNVSITAQALIPIARGRIPLYRGDGTSDILLHRPLRDYISFLIEALNIIPHGVGAQSKQLGVEVYEGCDLRLYIINPIGLLPPVNVSMIGPSVPLRRWWHLVRNSPAPFMQPPVQIYERACISIQFILIDILQDSPARRHKTLVRMMHENGLNICLLGRIAMHLIKLQNDDNDENRESLLRVISVEIIARAVRRVMYYQVFLDQAPRTIKTANSYLARAVAAMMDPEPDRFMNGLTPKIHEMFPIDSEDSILEIYLQKILRDNVLQVTKRLCALCGFVLNRGAVEFIDCFRSGHNFSSYMDANHESNVREFMLDANKENDVTRGLLTSLILPYRIVHEVRAGRAEEALRLSRRIVAVRARTKQQFLYFESLIIAAVVAAQCGDYDGAKCLLNRAHSGMNVTPVFELGAVKKSSSVAIPRNCYFLPGQIAVTVVSGFLLSHCEDYSAARDRFLRAIDLVRTIDNTSTSAKLATHMALIPFAGLLETATRSSVVTTSDLINLWGELRRRLAPSLFGATICEQLGSLLLERGMYKSAAERMRDALEIIVLLLGDSSYEAGVMLNKLSFVYYMWDVKRFGVLCSCLLQFAESIMIEAKGEYSVSHLCVVENIVMVLMMRGNFVAASKRLTEVLQPTTGKTFHISRDHPVTVRLYETQERLKTLFKPTAIAIIQRHWRDYRRRLALESVFEVNACLLQRVGRGMVRRWLLMLYSRSKTPLEELHRRDREFLILNFTKPLLRGSELLSKKCRNWNGESQHYHQIDQMWDAATITERKEHICALDREFHAAVVRCVTALRDSPQLLTPVPHCLTSFVMENIVITQVAKGDQLARMQANFSALLRRSPTLFFTATVADYIEIDNEAYFAQALVPIHRQPQIIIATDGNFKANSSDAERDVVNEVCWLLFGRGLAEVTGNLFGLEILKAMNGMWYVTNGMGFLSFVGDRVDELPESFASSPYQEAVELCAVNQQGQAVTLMEQYILSRKWTHDAGKYLAHTFLAYCRAAAGEVEAASKLFKTSADAFEQMGWLQLSGRLHYLHGRSLLRMGEYVLAIEPLMEQFRKLKGGRFHAYYAAYPILDTALWLGRACRGAGKSLSRAVITFTLHVVTNSEPTELLFEACATMTQYCMESGDLQLAEEFATVRERKAKELDKASSLRHAKALLDHSQLLFKRGDKESYEASASLLIAAIRIVETVQPNSLMLGIMLNNYGSLLTHLNKLPSAKKALINAQRLIQTHVSREHQEMISWRKNMKVLQSKLRQGAALRIQRAVRRWLEKRGSDRKLEQEDPVRYGILIRQKLLWRLKRLILTEATARIFIADEENEEHYILQSRQRQMLGGAKMATLLRETRGARVSIHQGKLTTSILELIHLEEGIRSSLKFLEQSLQVTIFTQALWEQHRLGRRFIISENHMKNIELKLWCIENVQTVIRGDMLKAHLKLLFHFVIREEAMWRKFLDKTNRHKKRALGVKIGHVLKQNRHHSLRHKRRKNYQRRFEDLLIEEQIHREMILSKETGVSRDFFFGPLVDSEDDSSGIGND